MPEETLAEMIADLREEEALGLAGERAASGEDPLRILEECRRGVEIVGRRYEDSQYFLPDLIMAGEILRGIGEIVKPGIMKEDGDGSLGRFLIGTVRGDIHDIGKDVVAFMLEANGFEVHDLGVDVPPETFVEKIRELRPEIVGLSGLLTIAFDAMRETVDAIQAAGLRDGVKIVIGGSQVDEIIREHIGADAYASDAVEAVALAKKWVGG
jgi:5-methyltetrahydrofolate--homocysteine methyltransferase